MAKNVTTIYFSILIDIDIYEDMYFSLMLPVQEHHDWSKGTTDLIN